MTPVVSGKQLLKDRGGGDLGSLVYYRVEKFTGTIVALL